MKMKRTAYSLQVVGRFLRRFGILPLFLVLIACTMLAEDTVTTPSSPSLATGTTAAIEELPTTAAMPSTATPTLTATPTTTPQPLSIPPPLPGWAWYDNQHVGYAVAYPESWSQNPFVAPDNSSQVEVQVLSIGMDWLTWVRNNRQRLLLSHLSPEQITANATFQGRSAFFHFYPGAGGGTDQVVLVGDVGDNRILYLKFDGVLREVEASILRHMIESFVLRDGGGETSLPTGWEQGLALVTYLSQTPVADNSLPIQALEGTIEAATIDAGNVTYNFVLNGDDGRQQVVHIEPYYIHFPGGPLNRRLKVSLTELLQVGNRVRVVGRPLASGDILAQYIAVEQNGAWSTGLYTTLFNVNGDGLDPALLAYYPQDETFELWLRGSLQQALPYLVDGAGNTFTGAAFSAETEQEVLAYGTLQTSAEPRLQLESLYAFVGECETFSDGEVEVCYPWQQLYPPVTTP